MWVVLAAPLAILLTIIGSEVLVRWIVSRPPLALPQDADVRRRADEHLRQWGIWRSYVCFSMMWAMVLLASFLLLSLGPLTSDAHIKGVFSVFDMALWFCALYIFTIIICLLLVAVLQPTAKTNATVVSAGQVNSTNPSR
jgi:formate-dependent nitrite reductase membrane component NrfD